MDKKTLLKTLTVGDIWELVVPSPTTIVPEAPLVELLKRIVEDTRTRHVYVVDPDQRLLGVVRLTSVTGMLFPVEALAEADSYTMLFKRLSLSGDTVGEVMQEACFVHKDTHLQDMARLLIKEKITELPVVDDTNRLVGQVNMYEVIEAYLRLRDQGVKD